MAAAGSLYGGISSSKAAKKARREAEEQRRRNQNWFDRRYNEDETQRADAQRLLSMTEESIRNRNRAAAGAQAVSGGTDESVAATKVANSKALANAASAINAQADARKDNIEKQYRQADEGYSEELRGIENDRAKNIAAATQGVVGAAGNIANAIDGTATGETSAGEQEKKKPSGNGS